MPDAVIVDAVRTPVGKRNGALSSWHSVDLAAHVLRAVAERSGLDTSLVDDVIVGCVSQVDEQALNVARNAVLAAGWPESVPGTTVDRQCGSSQQAMHFAAQGVMAGAYDLVVAAGVEVMSRVPMGASVPGGFDKYPFTESINERYASVGGLQPQGIGADKIADRWDISRADMDAYAARSHQCAARAVSEGRFDHEIVPVPVAGPGNTSSIFDRDEGIRPDSSAETLSKLKPAFSENGKITAANSSQISDGASAVLIVNADRADALGLTPRARFHSFAVAGADPVTMLTGPIPATRKVLERSGLTIDDIDLFEVNEAFASVVLAWEKELKPDMAKVNVNGGAIALGHPLGSSGTKLMATLVNELERTGGRYGLQVMCEGGGMANATIVERLG